MFELWDAVFHKEGDVMVTIKLTMMVGFDGEVKEESDNDIIAIIEEAIIDECTGKWPLGDISFHDEKVYREGK